MISSCLKLAFDETREEEVVNGMIQHIVDEQKKSYKEHLPEGISYTHFELREKFDHLAKIYRRHTCESTIIETAKNTLVTTMMMI